MDKERENDDFVLVEIDQQECNIVQNNPITWDMISTTSKNVKYIVEKSIGNAHRIYLVYYIGSTMYRYRYWIYGIMSIVW